MRSLLARLAVLGAFAVATAACSNGSGGALPARHRWRERVLRPIAKRIGERRARTGYEAAVRGFERIVTGQADDPRALIELLTADLAGRLASRR